jgi:hypothetical protein
MPGVSFAAPPSNGLNRSAVTWLQRGLHAAKKGLVLSGNFSRFAGLSRYAASLRSARTSR